jgi:hypothetical protein
MCRAPVAHAYNPSYSGGRDQEDRGLKPVQATSLWDSIPKKPITKKGWWSGSRCRSWVQALTTKKVRMYPQYNNNKKYKNKSIEKKITNDAAQSEWKWFYTGDLRWKKKWKYLKWPKIMMECNNYNELWYNWIVSISHLKDDKWS